MKNGYLDAFVAALRVSPRSVTAVSFAIGFMFLPLRGQLQAQSAITLPAPFHFDGSSFVTVANSPALSPTSQVTITAWIKPNFAVSNVTDSILVKRDGCNFDRSYQLGIVKTIAGFTPGTIFFSPSNANTGDLLSTIPVPNDGRFHHVAGTYDGASVKVFLDGVLVGQRSHTGSIPVISASPVIGVQAGCGDPTYADIAQVKLFDYALPDSQIMSEGASSGVAVLNGGNSFSGNQTVSGTVAATSFTGNGAGLSQLNPAQLSPGTAAINITGSAATAVSASTAITAADSAGLGGVTAASYARVDQPNVFRGNQNIEGAVTVGFLQSGTTLIGGGTPIVRHLSALYNPVIGEILPTSCMSTTVAFPTASEGDTVSIGLPNSRMSSGVGLIYTAWVSSQHVVSIRVCNIDKGGKNPSGVSGSGAIRVDVWKH